MTLKRWETFNRGMCDPCCRLKLILRSCSCVLSLHHEYLVLLSCSMASTIIQVYLKQLLESFFHTDATVRMTALNVIELVLKQGLVHPVQVSRYQVMCMCLCTLFTQTYAVVQSLISKWQ